MNETDNIIHFTSGHKYSRFRLSDPPIVRLGLKLTKFASNSEHMTQTSIKLGNPCLCIKECY